MVYNKENFVNAQMRGIVTEIPACAGMTTRGEGMTTRGEG